MACIFTCVLLGVWFLYRVIAARDHSIDLSENAFGAHGRRVILLFLLGIHLVATLFFFPPEDLFNDRPVVTLDHSFHYYQVVRASEEFPKTGRLHYYDPYYMAGYPTAIFDLDIKAAELFCVPFSGTGVARALKVFVLLCYLTLPLACYKGCRFAGFAPGEALTAVIVLLAFWHWGRPYASHFRYAGMFGFVLVSHVSLLVVGLFHRFLIGKELWPFFLFGPLAFFFHPTAVVIFPLSFMLLIVLERRWLTMSRSFLFLLWCLVVIAFNSVWVVPMFQNTEVKSGSDTFFQIAGIGGLLDVLIKPGSLPALLVIGLSVIGAFRLHRQRRAVELAAFFSTAVFLLIVAAYGIYLPGLKHLEPGRFVLTALFFLSPCAGVGVHWLWDRFTHAYGGRRSRAAFALALVGFAMSPILLSYLSTRTGYRHRLRTTPTPAVERLIEAVTAHTDTSGRLMIEDGPAYLYGESHLPGLLTRYTGVEQIGGPYPFAFVRHHFTTFQVDKTMGRPLAELSAEDMWAYIDLYNVLWIATASAEGRDSVARLGSEPAGGAWSGPARIEQLWEYGRYTLWRVNRRAAFTSVPGSRVVSAYDRLVVEVADGVEELMLKYHWDKGLNVTPPAEITARHALDDPVPFIVLRPNGQREVVITY